LGFVAIIPAAICMTNIVFSGWFPLSLGGLLLALNISAYFAKVQLTKCYYKDYEEAEGMKLTDGPKRNVDVEVDQNEGS